MSWEGDERRKDFQVCANHSGMEKHLARIDVALYGNGHPENGIVWKVTENTKFIEDVRNVFWKGFWFSMVACCSAIGTFAILLFKLLMKHGMV